MNSSGTGTKKIITDLPMSSAWLSSIPTWVSLISCFLIARSSSALAFRLSSSENHQIHSCYVSVSWYSVLRKSNWIIFAGIRGGNFKKKKHHLENTRGTVAPSPPSSSRSVWYQLWFPQSWRLPRPGKEDFSHPSGVYRKTLRKRLT